MEPGRRIGRWQLSEELARGGQGVVYAARDAEGREAALKLLLEPLDLQGRLRFQQEVGLLLGLDHSNLPRLYDAGEERGHPWVAMERVSGPSLDRLVATTGPLAPARAARLLAQVARSLAHCHARGVVHRDVKPLNMLLDPEAERVVLVDLGLARRDASGSLERLTRTGELLGTPAYMAPEQVSPGGAWGQPGPASDLYGLGATLFHLLEGRPPFAGGSPLEVFQQVLAAEAPRLSRAVSPRLGELCARCLARDPGRRPASAEDVAATLELCAREQPDRAASRGRRAWLAGAALVGLGGLGGALLLRGRGADAGGPAASEAPTPAASAGAVTGEEGPAAVLARVTALCEGGRLEEALAAAEEGLRRWPDDPRTLYGRAVTRGLMGQLAGARDDLERVLELDPEHLKARLNRAVVRNQLGEQAGAEADFARVVELDPQDAMAWAALGQLLMRRGEQDRASECLERALALDPDEMGGLVGRGELRLRAKDAQLALTDLERALALQPGAPDVLLLRARALRQLGRTEEGLASLEELVQRVPREAAGWAELAIWRTERLEAQEARRAVERWRELAPHSPNAWRWTARVALVSEDVDLAEEAAGWLLARDPADSDGLYARAAVRRRHGDRAGALSDVKQLLTLDPNHPGARLERAILRLDEQDGQGALEDAEAVLTLMPHAPSEAVKGKALDLLGRAREAEAAFGRAIAIDPRYVEGWLLRGALRARRGELEGARVDAREVQARLDGGARLNDQNQRQLRELLERLGVDPSRR